MFERKEDDKDKDEILFESEIEEKDIPKDTIFNQFVNWFRLGND